MSSKEHPRVRINPAVDRVIGQGMAFPFTFSERGRSRQVDVESGIEKINQSIHMILSTYRGERIMNPEFGSNLRKLVFEPEDIILYDTLVYETAGALQRWEPRIQITNVIVYDSAAMREMRLGHSFPSHASDHEVGIGIEYVIRSSHVSGSYVYPFRLGGLPSNEFVRA